MGREKDVSTRLIRPTIPEFDASRLLLFVERWDSNWEHDASIKITAARHLDFSMASLDRAWETMKSGIQLQGEVLHGCGKSRQKIFDEGIAQYMLTDIESHYKYLAALILSKPSLRCRLEDEEPEDFLDAEGNKITLITSANLSIEDAKKIDYLKQVLYKRGYRFD